MAITLKDIIKNELGRDPDALRAESTTIVDAAQNAQEEYPEIAKAYREIAEVVDQVIYEEENKNS